jgi:D-alanyl-D-alanine dipeptidase
MRFADISPPAFDVDLDLRYARAENFTGVPVYARAAAYLHPEAAEALRHAAAAALRLGYRLRINDAYRPPEAQWRLWQHTPDPDFLTHPDRGSPHSRGVAVDLTLLDADGRELDMGTPFDAFTPASHHGHAGVGRDAQRHRMLLLGLMTESGWDFYRKEWWHYQLFNARERFPLVPDGEACPPLMG